MSFDPAQHRTTTRQQWKDAVDAWHRWGPTLETWLGAAAPAEIETQLAKFETADGFVGPCERELLVASAAK